MLTTATSQQLPETGQFHLLQTYSMQLGLDRDTPFDQRHQTLFDGRQGDLAMLFKTCRLPPQFSVLLTRPEFSRQARQTPPTVLPDATQLKKNRRVCGAFRVGKQSFKLLEALLPPERRALLLAQLIGKAVPVPLQAGKFTFQLGAIPEQLQEPLVLGGLSTHKQLLGNGCHSTLQT
ncbi:MAG: hypothetical protein KDI87_03695 [Gammaproteobacteria bacterium]|nr:hypothetical protein [Gammaproteobacteria bacterium]